MRNVRKLTPRQQVFADAYLGGLDATASARAAGISKAAKQRAHDWLKLPHIQAYLADRRAEISSPKVRSAQERQELLSQIAFGEVEDSSLCFGEVVRHPPDLKTRMKAMELLARMRGELTDQPPTAGVVYVVAAPSPAQDSASWAREVEAEVVAEGRAKLTGGR